MPQLTTFIYPSKIRREKRKKDVKMEREAENSSDVNDKGTWYKWTLKQKW